MPEIIADTSVIQYLYQCDYLSTLPALYGTIEIPLAVVNELEVGRTIGVALPKVYDYELTELLLLLEQLNNLGFRASNSTQLAVLRLAGEVIP